MATINMWYNFSKLPLITTFVKEYSFYQYSQYQTKPIISVTFFLRLVYAATQLKTRPIILLIRMNIFVDDED